MSSPKPDRDQIARFKEAARKLGADDDEDRFNERLRRLAKQKPKSDGTESEAER